MKKTTVILHESMLRAAKMVISAWEKWLEESKKHLI